MCLDADLLTHVEHGTGGAVGQIAGAYMFAEGYKQAVDLDPIPTREFRFQRQHGFFWRRCLHVAPTIGDPVDMHIHTDERLTTGNP